MIPAIVEVTWYDARFRSKNDTLSIAAKDTGYIRRTVGYVVRNDKRDIVVAMTFDGDQDIGDEVEVDDRLTIPRGMIRAVKVLRRRSR